MKKRRISPSKAETILHEGVAHGKPITEKQRRFFGARASGYPVKTKEEGGTLKKEKTITENYIVVLPYDETNRLFHASKTQKKHAYLGRNDEIMYYENEAKRMSKSEAENKLKQSKNKESFIKEIDKIEQHWNELSDIDRLKVISSQLVDKYNLPEYSKEWEYSSLPTQIKDVIKKYFEDYELNNNKLNKGGISSSMIYVYKNKEYTSKDLINQAKEEHKTENINSIQDALRHLGKDKVSIKGLGKQDKFQVVMGKGGKSSKKRDSVLDASDPLFKRLQEVGLNPRDNKHGKIEVDIESITGEQTLNFYYIQLVSNGKEENIYASDSVFNYYDEIPPNIEYKDFIGGLEDAIKYALEYKEQSQKLLNSMPSITATPVIREPGPIVIGKIELSDYDKRKRHEGGGNVEKKDNVFIPEDIYWSFYAVARKFVNTNITISKWKDGSFDILNEKGDKRNIENVSGTKEGRIWKWLNELNESNKTEVGIFGKGGLSNITNEFEYKTIHMGTQAGIQEAKNLKSQGWVTESTNGDSMQLYRPKRSPLSTGKRMANGGKIDEKELEKMLVEEYHVYPEYAISYIENGAYIKQKNPSFTTREVMNELEKKFPQLTQLKNTILSPDAKKYADSLRTFKATGGQLSEKEKEANHQLRYGIASATTAKEYIKDLSGNEEDKEKAEKEIMESIEHTKSAMEALGRDTSMKKGGETDQRKTMEREIEVLKEGINSQATDEPTKTSMRNALSDLQNKLAEEIKKSQRNVTIPADSFWVAIDEKYANKMRTHLGGNNIKFTSRNVKGKYTIYLESQELLDRVVTIYNMKRAKGKDTPVSPSDISGKSDKGGKLWSGSATKKEISLRNKARRMGILNDQENLSETHLKTLEKESPKLKKKVSEVRTMKQFKQ